MELSSSDKERIQHQYDALAKKTLVGEAKSYRRTLAKCAAREVKMNCLPKSLTLCPKENAILFSCPTSWI